LKSKKGKREARNADKKLETRPTEALESNYNTTAQEEKKCQGHLNYNLLHVHKLMFPIAHSHVKNGTKSKLHKCKACLRFSRDLIEQAVLMGLAS
jgi:hypothetical protein